MKRSIVLAALLALALPAAALGKGPSEATVTGLGLGKTITIGGGENEGAPVMHLAEAAGFFPAVFGQEPNPMLPGRPKGNLGPKYAIDYKVPGGEGATFQIRQDAYPYAKPNGVTYMPPGQAIFDMKTRGGWFTDAQLKEAMKVPATPPAAQASSSAGFLSAGRIGIIGGVVVFLAAIGWFYLRPDRAMGGRNRRSPSSA
ncbi:MAG: hypothetical protein ABI896_07145 [Actinomycetota bacterium]